MAIQKPGERFRYHNLLSRRKGKRGVVAMLSLTAMVDMFTVLVIFLLQNFSGEEQMLQLHPDLELPKATSIKDLKPAFVVTVSNKEILLDEKSMLPLAQVKTQEEWMIQPLLLSLQEGLKKSKADFDAKLQNKLRDAVQDAKGEEKDQSPTWNKITIQADKNTDLLTIKKVMFTITEAGAGEINFAVLKDNSKNQPPAVTQ